MTLIKPLLAILALGFQQAPASRPANATISPFVISGRIQNEAGVGVRGARVILGTAAPLDFKNLGEGMSDATGLFTIPGSAAGDYYQLEVRADGFAPSWLKDIRTRDVNVNIGNITLFAPVLLKGTVLGQNHEPLANANIYAAPGARADDRLDEACCVPRAITNEKGEYQISTFGPGYYTFGASAKGLGNVVIPGTRLEGGKVNILNIEMEKIDSYTGTVVDQDKKPIAGATVVETREARIEYPNVSMRYFWRTPIVTDENGRFCMEGVRAPDPRRLEIWKRGFLRWDDHLPSCLGWHYEFPEDRIFILENHDPIHIQAIGADGKPASIRRAWLQYGGGMTNYYCKEVEPRQMEIASDHEWRIYLLQQYPDAVSISFDPDTTLELFPISFSSRRKPKNVFVASTPPGSINGTVTYENGVAAADVEVMLAPLLSFQRECRGLQFTSRTDEKGFFKIINIQRGLWELTAISTAGRTAEGTRVDLRKSDAAQSLSLQITKGFQISGNITIGGKPPVEPVMLQIIDARDSKFGEVPSNRSEMVTSTETIPVISIGAGPDATHPVSTVRSSPDGSFTSAPLPPGTYLLLPHTPQLEHLSVRSFASEFRSPGKYNFEFTNWPWIVDIYKNGEVGVVKGKEVDDRIQINLTSPRRIEFRGIVKDNGKAVPGAEVSALSADSLYLHSTTTDANGRFLMILDRAGDYKIRIEFGEVWDQIESETNITIGKEGVVERELELRK